MLRSVTIVLAMLPALLAAHTVASAQETLSATGRCDCDDCRTTRCTKRGAWFVTETENFSVWSGDSRGASVHTAATCEELLVSIRRNWELDSDQARWQPKCAVVIHSSRADYRRELGAADDSVGCTTVSTDDDRIVFRRIDLRADAPHWRENALPHELTHVVLADRFNGHQLPHWLNEGLAILSENRQLHSQRHAVLTGAQQRGRLPSLESVLSDRGDLVRRDANLSYSVSASLVGHLLRHGDRRRLLGFVDNVLADGYESALLAAYPHLGGVENWERQWLESIPALKTTPLQIP